MDSPYSPLAVGGRTRTVSASRSPPPEPEHGRTHGHAESHSPPLVPIPHPHSHPRPHGEDESRYDPNFHRHSSSSRPGPYPVDTYHRDRDVHYRDPYAHSHGGGGGGGGYPRDDWQYQRERPSYHHSGPPDYHSRDPYYRPPPPPMHLRDPYGYPPPRDPYGYPVHRDDFYGSNYPPPPPREPYYPGPPPVHQHSRDYHSNHSHFSIPPPASSSVPPPSVPVATSSAASSVPPPPFPLTSTAVSLGPHPIHGHLDPASDLSIPILYLARPISTKTFTPLRNQFRERLELRFVNSLLELERDLKTVDLHDRERQEKLARQLETANATGDEVAVRQIVKDSKRVKRRIWISAVGGTDALVQKVWSNTPEKIEWKETIDLNHLGLELMYEDRRVEELLREQEEEEERERRGVEGDGGADKEDGEQADERAREWEEQERGRREIEQRELEGKNRPRGQGQVEELDRVLRAVRGESGRDMAEHGASSVEAQAEPREPSRLGTSRAGERGEAVIERFEDMVQTGTRDDGYNPTSASLEQDHSRAPELANSRKRSRHESEEAVDHSASRAARKKLEAICKAPRRNCAAWAHENDVAINEETRMVDEEPVLGERHRGVWNLFGHELDDISPQIQVLMARTMRDATYPPRLRLYSTPEAYEQLEEAVPWFMTLLRMIGDRYELAGAASIVPQDPPVSENPLETETAESPTLALTSETAPRAA